MKFKTPKGTAGYPKLFRPDTKFKAEGVYSLSVSMPMSEEAQALITSIEEGFAEEFGNKSLKTGNMPFEVNEDDNTVTFKFKSKFKPTVYDAAKNELDEESRLGSGSVVRVAGTARFVEAAGKRYATLGLNQVKVLKLVKYNSDPFGDDEEDDADFEEQRADQDDDEKPVAPKTKTKEGAKRAKVESESEEDDEDF